MLSRKNKDLRTIKEGVVGKYVKKDTPPEMPSKIILIFFLYYSLFNFLNNYYSLFGFLKYIYII